MINIALVEPEIPENTGNIIRLCANVGAILHLVRPYGFIWDEKRMKRSAMDYLPLVDIIHHNSLDNLLASNSFGNIYALTTKATKYYHEVVFKSNDLFLFGSESRGLSSKILEDENFSKIKIPMKTGRSINLSNAVAIVAYEASRQIGF